MTTKPLTTKPRTRVRSRLLTRARQTARELGPVLGHVREIRGHSLREVMRLTDYAVDATNISRIEGGSRQDPRLSTLLVLCVAYDIDIHLNRTGEVQVNGTKLNGPIRVKPKKEEQ